MGCIANEEEDIYLYTYTTYALSFFTYEYLKCMPYIELPGEFHLKDRFKKMMKFKIQINKQFINKRTSLKGFITPNKWRFEESKHFENIEFY